MADAENFIALSRGSSIVMETCLQAAGQFTQQAFAASYANMSDARHRGVANLMRWRSVCLMNGGPGRARTGRYGDKASRMIRKENMNFADSGMFPCGSAATPLERLG
jgi:hypothetical protein